MGLSASQARLLTITARKSDCEFQSMSLSHQKIALARDMENITNEYQNALNQTKLVYDFYGTGSSELALNYSLLMSPSVFNDYYPRFVTDSTNKIILNSAIADAARAAGIPAEGLGGTSSSDVREAFIQALAQEGILSAAQVQSIEATPYNNAVGLGKDLISDVAVDYITYEEFVEKLNTSTISDMKDYGLYLGDFYTLFQNGYEDWKLLSARDHNGDKGWIGLKGVTPDANDDSYSFDNNSSNPYSAYGSDKDTGVYVSGRADNSGETGNTNYHYITKTHRDDDNNAYNSPDPASIKLTDLFLNDTKYTFTIDSHGGVVSDAAYMQRLLVGDDNSNSMLNWMTDLFLEVLGSTSLNEQALAYARNNVMDLLWPDNQIQSIAMGINTYEKFPSSDYNTYVKNISAIGAYKTGANWKDLVENAEKYIGFYTRTGSGVSVNLNNVAQVFLTSFIEYTQGLDNTNYSYGPMKKSDANMFNPKSDSAAFEVLLGANADTGADKTTATFYDTMFNMLCTHGWVENERIEDTDYMQEMIKNGLIYMSAISEDGYYHQEKYSTDKYVLEVYDEDAIAQAEAKYKAAKARIETKENTLDLKMKNLDTEISSLTQEYDSVKNIIKQSIDKSFTRYEA